MNPKSAKAIVYQRAERGCHGLLRRHLTDIGEVEHTHVWRRLVTSVPSGLFVVAPTERNDVVRVNQRPESFELGHDRRPAPGHKSQIGGSDLPVDVRVRLVVVRVTIDEQEPETPSAAQREHRTEKDRAIASQYDGYLAAMEDLADRVGEGDRIPRDRLGVEHCRLGIAAGIVSRWLNSPCIARR